MDIKDLRSRINLSQRQFSTHFGIPLGTLRNWEQGLAKPPEYVFSMIFKIIRRDKMLNVETMKFMKKLDKLADLTKGGIEEFANATSENKDSKVFYDKTAIDENGNFHIVDGSVVDDHHHDIICYHGDDSHEYTIVVSFVDDEQPFIIAKLIKSNEEIVIENGTWYFA